ncbi:capsule biosynthesis protein, partial [Proteus sp. G4444]|nr:capsule biosynthesis protein [Proteus sp. G4444]
KIIENKLSKYNNQPLEIPIVGKTNKPKALVIDQSYGDMSLKLGMVDDNVFQQMITDAINENPDHEVIFKTHPDTIANNSTSEFIDKFKDKVTVLTEYTNPISLLTQIDRVYVATSQMGFEALMCGKPVHVYGLPFYAGWGLTIDKQSTNRRKRNLTLEELFFIAYIKYSYYINPKTKKVCSINEAINYLINLRDSNSIN